MGTMLEELKKLMEDPAKLAEMREHFGNEMEIKDKHMNSVNNYIKSLSDDELQKKMDSFIKWEEKYERFMYDERQLQASSNIFHALFNTFREYGESLDENEDFLNESYTYRGYKSQIFSGQGCFYRLWYSEECIFQST